MTKKAAKPIPLLWFLFLPSIIIPLTTLFMINWRKAQPPLGIYVNDAANTNGLTLDVITNIEQSPISITQKAAPVFFDAGPNLIVDTYINSLMEINGPWIDTNAIGAKNHFLFVLTLAGYNTDKPFLRIRGREDGNYSPSNIVMELDRKPIVKKRNGKWAVRFK